MCNDDYEDGSNMYSNGDDLFEKSIHEDDLINERYNAKSNLKSKKDSYDDDNSSDIDDEIESLDLDDMDYIDLDKIDDVDSIEKLIDTGSANFYQKERTSNVTGKKVKNYVDNDTFCSNVIMWNTACKEAEALGKPKPPMPDVIGLQMLKIANGLSKRYNFRNYCVDSQTEALTQRGWLSYSEITTDDMILSMDVDSQTLQWSKIHEVFVNENYDDEMFELKSVGMDALITPQHKFVTDRGLLKVEDIEPNDTIITNKSSINSIEEVYTDKQVYNQIDRLSFDFISNLTLDQCNKLIESLILSDGKNINNYTTNDKKNLDIFIALCIMSGKRAFYHQIDGGSWSVVVDGSRDSIKASDFDVILESKKNIANSYYMGTIWCPRTDYGTFVCRRNGTVYVTGNTYIDEMREDAIYMAIRAVKNFDPTKSVNAYGYFNRVMWLAMTTRLKTEDKQHSIKMDLLKEPMYLGYTNSNDSRDNSNEVDKERLISVYDN